MKLNFLSIAFLYLILTASVFGQNSILSGKVTDQNGAAIAGAIVKIESSSGMSKTTTTDANGEFAFPDLTGGSYRITFEKTGFEEFSQEVRSGRTDLVFTLVPGDVSATVNISDETYAVEDASTATKLNVPLKDVP